MRALTWLRSHGWIQCDRGWSKAGVPNGPFAFDDIPITEKQATTKQGDKA